MALSSVQPGIYSGIFEHVFSIFIAGNSFSPNIQFPPKDSLLHNISNDVTDGAPSVQLNVNDATPSSIGDAFISAGSVCPPI